MARMNGIVAIEPFVAFWVTISNDFKIGKTAFEIVASGFLHYRGVLLMFLLKNVDPAMRATAERPARCRTDPGANCVHLCASQDAR